VRDLAEWTIRVAEQHITERDPDWTDRLNSNHSILTSRPVVMSSGGNAKPEDTARVRDRHCSLHGVRKVMLAERFGERDLPKIGA
jgi:hypothetical protein